MNASSPVVRTVAGDVDPATVGRTSMHEHTLVDARVWHCVRTPADARLKDLPVTPERIADVRWNAYSFDDNLLLDDVDLAVGELAAFAAAGGDLVVDMTSVGLGGDPARLAEIARRAGVRIVLGCGYYVHGSHDRAVCAASVDELERRIEAQVAGGREGTGVLPGIVGEIGMSAPPRDCERRVLRAGARVAARHGMSIHVHTDGGGAHAPEHVADCVAEGLAPDRVVCCHMDERIALDYHLAVLATGANVAFDTFGSELNFSGLFHHPGDRERIAAVAALVARGHADRIVVGHDVFVKAHLHAHGGNGYDHLLARVVPTLRHEHGFDEATVRQILVENPRRLLSCTPPPAAAAATGK